MKVSINSKNLNTERRRDKAQVLKNKELYERQGRAITYLRSIGKLWLRNVPIEDGCKVRVQGNQLLWSSGGMFKSETTFFIIDLQHCHIKPVTEIKELV